MSEESVHDILESDYDGDVTVNEALHLLATFELSHGTTSTEVAVDKVENRVNDYVDRIDNGDTIDEIANDVKSSIYPQN
jgi:hypothetical protein